ncbi:DUF3244 domain-containing protein [Bacteroides fluxus]|uniref:DUF3244 domain-containing protein n=1 Tax=Bacteroides fluxus TaxID=626930 RepID=UPI0023F4DAAB|nr:DUF3244 domain-containing protein [Bacteroides fluxus]
MKGTLFIAAITILSCLPASSLHAKKKIITLTEHFTTDNKIKWDEEERSLIGNIPFILHNQNIFYIYSGVLLEEAKLTIKDKYNHIVYTTIETMLPHEENVFILNIEKGNYTIELESKGSIYSGYFEITE